MKLAGSPVSWGVDFADHAANPPWDQILDGVASAGLRWTELGPIGYLPEDAEVLRAALDARRLSVAGSFVVVPLHDARERASTMAEVRRTCSAISAAGGRFLVIIDRVEGDRDATAGRCSAAVRLPPPQWDELVVTARAAAELAISIGLRPVFHHHAGSAVEFIDEIRALMAAIPTDLLGLCLDTGHAAYAGLRPEDLVAEFGPRIEYVHLKDVSPTRLRAATGARRSFWQALGDRVFCPLGDGVVDFAAVLRALDGCGFSGPMTLEQDRDPTRAGDPLGDLRRSIAYLRTNGLTAPLADTEIV